MSSETVSVTVELSAAIHRLMMPTAQQEGWDDLVAKALLRYHFTNRLGGQEVKEGEADD